MKSLFLKITTILLLFTQVMMAQDEEENIGFNQYSSSIFDSKENTLNLVSDMSKGENSSIQNQIPSGVLIQQIGEYNTFNANLRAEAVNISVSQNGNENQLTLDKEANSISQRVIQQGENNAITDFTYYTRYDVNMEMVQQGNNQNIQNYGTNSLSKDMKVTQTGNGASVIIINQ